MPCLFTDSITASAGAEGLFDRPALSRGRETSALLSQESLERSFKLDQLRQRLLDAASGKRLQARVVLLGLEAESLKALTCCRSCWGQ